MNAQFNALDYARELEDAGVPPQQAQIHVRTLVAVIKDCTVGPQALEAARLDILHRVELSETQLRSHTDGMGNTLRKEMHQLGANLRLEMHQLAADLRLEMHQLAADLRLEMHKQGVDLRSEIYQQGVELRAEIHRQGVELRAEIHQQGVELRAEIAKLRAELRFTRWMNALTLILVGALYAKLWV